MTDSVRAKRVSFVVPTKNSGATLRACLESLLAQGELAETIVVDNYSTDDTPGMAGSLADVFVQAGPERSAQRNLGARRARGEYVVFIDSDMTVDPDVAREVVSAFDEDERVQALVLPERVTGNGFWGRCREIEKTLYVGDDSVEAARAFRRGLFVEVGGYDESLTGPEDWDLPDRIRDLGHVVSRTEAGVEHHEPDLTLRGTFSKKRYYGRSLGRFARRRGVQSVRRAIRPTFFLRLLRMLPSRPLHVIGVLALKATEYLGGLVGAVEGRLRPNPSG